MPPLLLFDIDGTLLHGDGGQRAIARLGYARFGESFRADVEFAGCLDSQITLAIAEANGVPREQALAERDTFRDAYLEELEAELSRRPEGARILPGVAELLETLDALAAAGEVALGLVTGNFAAAAPIKLRAAGIDPARFVTGAFGDCADTRPELVTLALARESARRGAEVPPAKALVIGDTPHDIRCAQVNGVPCLAVCTGHYTRDDLAHADHLADDLRDPDVLLDLIRRGE